MVTGPEPEQQPALPDFTDLTVLLDHGVTMRTVNAFRRNGVFDIDALGRRLADYDRLGGWHDPDFNPVGLGVGSVDEAKQALAAYRSAHPPTIETE